MNEACTLYLYGEEFVQLRVPPVPPGVLVQGHGVLPLAGHIVSGIEP